MILFLKLLISHVLVDFFLQPKSWVEKKKEKKHRSFVLYIHALLAGVAAYVLVAEWAKWWIIPAVFIPHLLIDLWKLIMPPKTIYFVIDQLVHLVNLWIVALILGPPIQNLTSVFGLLTETENMERFLIIVAGLMIITLPAGIIIGMITQKYRDSLDPEDANVTLPEAGKMIGILERIFIFVAIIAGHFSAVGFLIAAKSILRYSDSKQVFNPVRMTEYIIIGTLTSFLFAVIVGVVCKSLLTFTL